MKPINYSRGKRELRLAQLNMNKSRAVQELMSKYIEEKGIDIVFGQEPNDNYVKRGKYFCDKRCDSFLYIHNDIAVASVVEEEGFVAVEMEDIVVVSCYFSPNRDLDEFKIFMGRLDEIIKIFNKKGCIMAGDLNAMTPAIGSKRTNARGKILEEFVAENELEVLNKGGRPTFRGAMGESVIDFTVATQRMAKKIEQWRVEEETENLSDHCTISFTIKRDIKREKYRADEDKHRWRVTGEGLTAFSKDIKLRAGGETKCEAEKLAKYIRDGCDKFFRRGRKEGKQLRPVYWWNENIAEQRRKCVAARREVTRANKGNDEWRKVELRNKYKKERQKLKKEIKKSKNEKWRDLCDELENDVWGQAYQILLKRIKVINRAGITKEELENQISKLFPEQNKVEILKKGGEPKGNPITRAELEQAVKQMKRKKAPGPDGIPSEVIKTCAESVPETMMGMYNLMLEREEFHSEWKIARLVMLEKPKKDESSGRAFRPICIINGLGKMAEILLNNRIKMNIEEKNMIHRQQYGFRKGLSTMNALENVLQIQEKIKEKAVKNREVCVMVTLDIENAFNSIGWDKIIKAMERKGVERYLINIIVSYLEERKIVDENGKIYSLSCGVPQGSVLGPTLWNLTYDEIMETRVDRGVELIAYADDLAVVVTAKSGEALERKAGYNVNKIIERIGEMGLKVAKTKTEMVLIEGRRKVTKCEIQLGETMVTSVRSMKYLGVWLDKDLRMTEHIQKISEKAQNKISLISRLMTKNGGPKTKKRKLIASTVMSAILYGAPIWARALKFGKCRSQLERVNRRLALAITTAYRTTATEAVTALAGMAPMDILVERRIEIYSKGPQIEREATEHMYRKWQERWDNYKGWTRNFVVDVREWSERGFGSLDHLVVQAMTGHGVFGVYLKRIGKIGQDVCWFCPERDTAEHTVFGCEEFGMYREVAEKRCGESITAKSIGKIMIRGEDEWNAVTDMLRNIMKRKGEEEKRRAKEGEQR